LELRWIDAQYGEALETKFEAPTWSWGERLLEPSDVGISSSNVVMDGFYLSTLEVHLYKEL
jgi:hypothetical protein